MRSAAVLGRCLLGHDSEAWEVGPELKSGNFPLDTSFLAEFLPTDDGETITGTLGPSPDEALAVDAAADTDNTMHLAVNAEP